MIDCAEIERTHALADGELAGSAADEARAHLASCATCQAELGDVLQHAALPVPGRAIVSLAWYRRRTVQVATIAVAAAAVVAIVVATRHRVPAPVHVALAATRPIEARLAWHGATAFRPYDVPRSAGDAREPIAIGALAELERTGDLHGVGALALLAGDHKQAERYLERAGESPDVLADRAAVALADSDPERALGLADAALERTPDHAVALWNRALALRDLQLDAAAASALHAVANLGEPGWSAEAAKRASALDAELADEHALTDRVMAARIPTITTGSGLTAADARALPGLSRLVFYDAVRAAPTAERLAALRPLADALDGGAAVLARAVPRGRLAEIYGKIIAGEPPPDRAQYLAALRAAHADDLLLGALIQLAPDRRTAAPDELAEVARLAAGSGDPWMIAFGLEQQARGALARGDLPAAEAIVLRARKTCPVSTPAFRCIRLGMVLGEVYLAWQRLPEARAVLHDTWQLAHAQRDWYAQLDILSSLATLATLGDDTAGSGVSLARAYGAELVARSPGCDDAARAHYRSAMALIDHLQPDAARRELAGVTECPDTDPATQVQHVYVLAQLARIRATDTEVAALRARIAALRATPALSPAFQALLDHSEGRLLVDRDPKAAEVLLRRAIATGRATPATDIDAHRAAAFSYALLALAAGKRGDGDRVIALLAEEQGMASPARCVLGLAADDEREVAVARDANGAAVVAFDEERRTPTIAPSTLVTPTLVHALAACPVVDVLARPPLHGMPRVLPEAIAWRYLSARPRPPGPPGDHDVVVAGAEPPAALGLPRLAAWSTTTPADLGGAAATPANVLAAISTARVAVIDSHGVVDLGGADGSYLALSPDDDGRYALTAATVRKATFAAGPVVILAACEASQAAPVMHEAWSLPAAFVAAGARAVIASAAPIPDAEAARFFDDVRARLQGDVDVAVAIRDARQKWLSDGRGDWVRDVLVFE